MNKESSVVWARNFNSLSKLNKSKLINYLPITQTRSISKKPLGFGQEGSIYSSVTGQEGESISKVFKDNKFSSNKNILDRIKLMKKSPNVYSRIYKEHPKGYVAEKLKPYTDRNATFETIKLLKEKILPSIAARLKTNGYNQIYPTGKNLYRGMHFKAPLDNKHQIISDIHGFNIGYSSKDKKWKLLDILNKQLTSQHYTIEPPPSQLEQLLKDYKKTP